MWNLRWVPPWKKEEEETEEEEEAEKRSEGGKVRGEGRRERDEVAIKGSREEMGLIRKC